MSSGLGEGSGDSFPETAATASYEDNFAAGGEGRVGGIDGWVDCVVEGLCESERRESSVTVVSHARYWQTRKTGLSHTLIIWGMGPVTTRISEKRV